MRSNPAGSAIIAEQCIFFKLVFAMRLDAPRYDEKMRLATSLLFALVLALVLARPCAAQSGMATSESVVAIEVVASTVQVAPGADLPVAILLTIQPGWHIWTNARPFPEGVAEFDGAVLTTVRLEKYSPALRVSGVVGSKWLGSDAFGGDPVDVHAQWPAYHQVKADVGEGEQSYPVFEGKTVVFVPISVAADAASGAQTLTLTIEFQACTATNCVAPSTVEIPLTVEVVKGAAAGTPPDIFSTFDSTLFAAVHGGDSMSAVVEFDVFDFRFSIDPRGSGFALLLAVAALGGLLLNFTPCVLPVIPLKIMSLARSAGNRRRCLALGTALSLGVVFFWIALGCAVALISGFTSSSQLFQYPLFTVAVGVIIAVMAFGMCGFFVVQLPQSIAGIDFRHDTLGGSVGFGVMTAVLSTPCTAPLMGAAAAWAATQAPWVVLVVFGAIGIGMALPYFVLSAFPQLVSHVPKSGPASDLVKQTMGLLLLAAAAYFVGAGLSGWMVAPPDPPSDHYWWFVSMLGVGAGVWLIWRTIRLTKRFAFRATFCALGLVIPLISGAIGSRMTDDGAIDWIPYTPQRLAAALKDGDVVLIDFTAEWCLNCKTLEKTVLESSSVLERLDAGGVRAIKVDLTGNNEAGRALLTSYARLTIPLIVILAPDGREVFKSDAYTPSQITRAIDEARAVPVPRAPPVPRRGRRLRPACR